MAIRLREGLSRPSVRATVVIVAVALVFALFAISRMPRPVAAVGTLGRCSGGWPVVAFEGEDWKAALPADLRPSAPRQVPVAAWPSGMRYDETAGALLDEGGDVVFHDGDLVRVAGTIVETDGDPAPCFFLLGFRVEKIAPP
jgi:hypothetical protein